MAMAQAWHRHAHAPTKAPDGNRRTHNAKKSGGFIGNRQSTLAALTFDQGFLDLIVQSEPFMALAITLATLCYRL